MSYSVVPCESGSGAPSQTTEPSSSSSIGPKSTECAQIFLKLQVQKERTQIDEKTQLLISATTKRIQKSRNSLSRDHKTSPPETSDRAYRVLFFL